MRALVVYESMYGNTHIVALNIAAGLSAGHDVTLVPVTRATPELVAEAGLLVVGAPTHMHGMSTTASRRMAADAARPQDSELSMDPDADGPGVHRQLEGFGGAGMPGSLGRIDRLARGHDAVAAAFDTRLSGVPLLTGRASRAISRLLTRHGYRLLAPPESFLVSKRVTLLDGEGARARLWGAMISEAASDLYASRAAGRAAGTYGPWSGAVRPSWPGISPGQAERWTPGFPGSVVRRVNRRRSPCEQLSCLASASH